MNDFIQGELEKIKKEVALIEKGIENPSTASMIERNARVSNIKDSLEFILNHSN